MIESLCARAEAAMQRAGLIDNASGEKKSIRAPIHLMHEAHVYVLRCARPRTS